MFSLAVNGKLPSAMREVAQGFSVDCCRNNEEVNDYMNRQAIRKSYRAITVIGLAITMLLSANVAMAAQIMIEKKNGSLELQPTVAAGNATGKINYMLIGEVSGVQVAMVPQIENLENTENVSIFLMDEEGECAVNIGKLDDGQFRLLACELKTYRTLVISRPDEDNDVGLVLFTTELPQHQ